MLTFNMAGGDTLIKYYIGIDISKQRLDIDWIGEHLEFSNETIGINKLIEKLKFILEKKN